MPSDEGVVAPPFLSLRGEQLWGFIRQSMDEGLFRNYEPSRFAVAGDAASLREANEEESDGRFVAPRVAAPPPFAIGDRLPLPRDVAVVDVMNRYIEAAGAKVASESEAALLRRLASASVDPRTASAHEEAMLLHQNGLQMLLLDEDVLKVVSCSFWLTVLGEFQPQETLDERYVEALFLSLSYSFTRFANRHKKSVAKDAVIAMDVVCSIAGATVLAFRMVFPYFIAQMTDASFVIKVERRLLSWLLGLDCLKRERLGEFSRTSESHDVSNSIQKDSPAQPTATAGTTSSSITAQRRERLAQRLADLEVANTAQGDNASTLRTTVRSSDLASKQGPTTSSATSATASPSRGGLLSRSAAVRAKGASKEGEGSSSKTAAGSASRATSEEIHRAVQLTEQAAWEMRDRTKEIQEANRLAAKAELESRKVRELRDMILPDQWIPPFRHSARAFHLDAVSPVVKSLLTAMSSQSRSLLDESSETVSAMQRCAHLSIRQVALPTTRYASSVSTVGSDDFLNRSPAQILGAAVGNMRWVYQRRPSSASAVQREGMLRNGTVSRWKELVTELLCTRPSLSPREAQFSALLRPVVFQSSGIAQSELSSAVQWAAETVAIPASAEECFDEDQSEVTHCGASVRPYSRPHSAASTNRRPPTPHSHPIPASGPAPDLGAFMTCVSTDPRTPYNAASVLARPSSALSVRSVVHSAGPVRPGSAASIQSQRTQPLQQRPHSAGGRHSVSLSISERKRGIQIRWTGDQPNADAAHHRFRKETAEKLRGSINRIRQLNADEAQATEQRSAAKAAFAVASGRTALERHRDVKTGLQRLQQERKQRDQSAMEAVIQAMEATTVQLHDPLKELDSLKEALFQIDQYFLALPESFRQQTLRFTASTKAKAMSIIRSFKLTNRDKSLWPRGLDHLQCPRSRETEVLGEAVRGLRRDRSASPIASPTLQRHMTSFGEELARRESLTDTEDEDSTERDDDAGDVFDRILDAPQKRRAQAAPVGSSAAVRSASALQRSATAELYNRYAGNDNDIGSKATSVRMAYLQKQQAPPEMFRHRLVLS